MQDVLVWLTNERTQLDGETDWSLRAFGPQTFDDQLDSVAAQAHLQDPGGDSSIWPLEPGGTNYHSATWRTVYRRLRKALLESRGVLRRQDRNGNPLDSLRADNCDPLVVDISGPLRAKNEEAIRYAGLREELGRLLGREYLQMYLLRQAEEGVLGQANDVLERVSGGALRLEPNPEVDRDAGTQKEKALDIVCTNADVAGEGIPIAFLSGSQRFRVAVSLALGIGRFAFGGAQRVQSIIIDERFGSLDLQDRFEMLDELRVLFGELERIPVVSHQEELAGSFENQYEIELIDGRSRVRLTSARGCTSAI